MKSKLTPKRKKFADYYIETANLYQSAMKAGYSKNYAKSQAHKLLENVGIKKYIEERMEKLDKERIASADEVLEYLTKVMRGNIKDQFGLEISIQDKTKAAELLGKRYRLFTDKVEIKGIVPVTIVGEDEIED